MAGKPLRLEQGQGSGLGPPDTAVFPGNAAENSQGGGSLGPLALPEHKILHIKNSFTETALHSNSKMEIRQSGTLFLKPGEQGAQGRPVVSHWPCPEHTAPWRKAKPSSFGCRHQQEVK